MAEALAIFSRQTGLQLIYVSDIVEARQSPGARAGSSASDTLLQLLAGMGLTFQFLNERTVRIFAAAEAATRAASPNAPARLPERPAAAVMRGLEEVIITGIHRGESLDRVPVDAVVWTESAMQASHINGIADISALTPGNNFGVSPNFGNEYTDLVIRGVTDLHGAATAIFVEDSPIPPSRVASYLTSFPLTFDLDRVEVLRGPQTVLLGGRALSGAIRFVPNGPSLTHMTGEVRAEWGITENGSPNYELGTAVGGPLIAGTLGFRLSAWSREDGGYVDRMDRSHTDTPLDKNINRSVQGVFRAAQILAPATGVQIASPWMHQSIYLHDATGSFDAAASDPEHGQFKSFIFQRQPWEQAYDRADLKLTAHFRAVGLAAFVSHFDQHFRFLMSCCDAPPIDPTDAESWTNYQLQQRQTLAELRFASVNAEAPVTWITGIAAIDRHERHPYQDINLPSNAIIVAQKELSVFGQIDLKVMKRLTASAGIRIGHWHYDPITESPPLFRMRDADSWTAPRLSLSLQADERDLFYLTLAKGYGSGGVNPMIPGDLRPAPRPPDALWNVEIGSKHTLLRGRLRLETTVFRIGWDNGPPDPFANGETGHLPAGTAVSDGFALRAQALVGSHSQFTVDLAHAEVHVTQTVLLDGQLWVAKGDNLPGSPWKLTASLEREFPGQDSSTVIVRVEDAYRNVPERTYLDDPASITYSPAARDPAVNVLNLRAAVKWPRLEVAAFVSNALNAHPMLLGSALRSTLVGPGLNYTLHPRTLSVSATWRY